MKDIEPGAYKALLNWAGLNIRDISTEGEYVRPAFQVLFGDDIPLGNVYCHKSNSIPIPAVIEYNTRFVNELKKYIGVRSSDFIKIYNNLMSINSGLRKINS